jgi:hypothetical protein
VLCLLLKFTTDHGWAYRHNGRYYAARSRASKLNSLISTGCRGTCLCPSSKRLRKHLHKRKRNQRGWESERCQEGQRDAPRRRAALRKGLCYCWTIPRCGRTKEGNDGASVHGRVQVATSMAARPTNRKPLNAPQPPV